MADTKHRDSTTHHGDKAAAAPATAMPAALAKLRMLRAQRTDILATLVRGELQLAAANQNRLAKAHEADALGALAAILRRDVSLLKAALLEVAPSKFSELFDDDPDLAAHRASKPPPMAADDGLSVLSTVALGTY